MKRPDISKTFKIIRATVSKHSPEILTGIGIAGMILTTVMAVRATPKALELLEGEKDERGTELEPMDMVKTAWKPYIPAAVTGTISVVCLISSTRVSAKRNTVLAAAYRLSEAAFAEYKEKTVETVGEKKEQLIRDKVARQKIEKDPVSNREIILTEKGDTLCYDALSGRYFKSDIDKIKKAENELNRELVNTMYISLNEFYYILGLKETKLGDDLGWNIDDGLIDITFSSQLADDGTPCLVMDYHIAPRYDYKDFG